MDIRFLPSEADDCVMLYIPMIPEANCARIGAAHSLACCRVSTDVYAEPIADSGVNFRIKVEKGGQSAGKITLVNCTDNALLPDEIASADWYGTVVLGYD